MIRINKKNWIDYKKKENFSTTFMLKLRSAHGVLRLFCQQFLLNKKNLNVSFCIVSYCYI